MKTKTMAELVIRGTISRQVWAGHGIAHIAPDGHWLRANQKVCETGGYRFDELLLPGFQAV